MKTKYRVLPTRRDRPDVPRPVVTGASLPATLALTERCSAMLRDYLDANGLKHYRIFASESFGLYDIDRLLPALGEADSAWEPAPVHTHGGHASMQFMYEDEQPAEQGCGFLRLYRFEVIVARWLWADPENGTDQSLTLVATPTISAFDKLRLAMATARRVSNDHAWQIFGEGVDKRPPRGEPDTEGLVLPEALLDRIRTEVLGFFQPAVQQMYAGLKVPYRRGVLLYGPPGNGKTSLIRWIGASLPQVAAMAVRPWDGFSTGNLTSILEQWADQAPAILVLEDLDWVLEQVNVSTFLNLLDGLSKRPAEGGLMLIGTTNHPDKLDPAVNNRPGRFDACIELALPDADLRERYLRRQLPELGDELTAAVVAGSDGLSFAHLQELLRLSGLRALNAGRTARSREDVMTSLKDVKEAADAAARGFPAKLDMPFGLGYLHKKS